MEHQIVIPKSVSISSINGVYTTQTFLLCFLLTWYSMCNKQILRPENYSNKIYVFSLAQNMPISAQN